VGGVSHALIVEGSWSSGRRQQWEESVMGGACDGRRHSGEGQVLGEPALVILNMCLQCVC
jgi:hypothetical protein